MISNTKKAIGAAASGLVMLLTGAASAQDAGAKADAGAGTAGANSGNVPAVCSVAPVSHDLSYEGFNHPELAVYLFRRPREYNTLDTDEKRKNLVGKLFGKAADESAKRLTTYLEQSKDDIEYLIIFSDIITERILQLDQKAAQSESIARGYINLLTQAIEQRPTLERFFAKCGKAPATGFPTRTGPYNTCLGYTAFVAHLEDRAGACIGDISTGVSIEDIRKLSPLVNAIAKYYSGRCAKDIAK